jgi:beta-barrel assembly-enhancing protease
MKQLIRITLAAALLGTAALPFSHADLAGLPSMGDTAGQLISPEQEKQFGESFMRQIRRSGKLVQDPELNDYIQNLGYQLAAASDAPGYGFTFFLVDDTSINAFAGPGGYIGVHTGLLLAARNESELAGVLAHEIAHVTQRHLLRAYEAAQRMSLPTAAALIAAILIGSQDGQAGQAALVGIQAASAQYQINFTRANEHEADRVGIQTLARAGIDPRGMPDFFERLHQQTRLYGSRLPEFLSTHPVTTNRIAETAARAEALAGGRRDSLGFQLARVRLQVGSSTQPRELVADYEARADSLGEAERFGYALALWRVGDPDGARRELSKLRRHNPDRLGYPLNLARLELEQNQPARALALYEELLDLNPGNVTVTRAYAAALISQGQVIRARDLLASLIQRGETRQPELYRLLAEAAGKAGRQRESHEATAEYYYLNGQTHAAIDQLELALQVPGLDFYDNARISARLHGFKNEARQEEGR